MDKCWHTTRPDTESLSPGPRPNKVKLQIPAGVHHCTKVAVDRKPTAPQVDFLDLQIRTGSFEVIRTESIRVAGTKQALKMARTWVFQANKLAFREAH